jgi:hypothetical protein
MYTMLCVVEIMAAAKNIKAPCKFLLDQFNCENVSEFHPRASMMPRLEFVICEFVIGVSDSVRVNHELVLVILPSVFN